MKNFFNKKFSTKTKLISSAISLMLIVCFAITGTVAWLMDTDEVIDTFTYGNVDIMLVDNDKTTPWGSSTHSTVAAGLYNTNEKKFKLIPGATIAFDPYVKVGATSESCFVFVKIEKTNNTFANATEDVYDYQMAEGWTTVDEANGVYGYTTALTADTDKQIIKEGSLTVNTALTNGAITGEANFKITAYAIQSNYLKPNNAQPTLAEAWALIQQNPPTPYNP